MDIDLIAEVKKTESIAEQIIKQAESQGQEKLNQTIVAMEKLLSETKEQLKQHRQIEQQKAQKAAEIKAKEIEIKIANEIKQLRNLNPVKIDKAVSLIIEHITKEFQK